MPIDYKKYPPNWKELRSQVLERAKNKCEDCGVENYALGFRDKIGLFHEVENTLENEFFYEDFKIKLIKIVLTIAHLDHDEENHNVKIDRLKALCRRCHLRYNVEEKKKRRKNKKTVGSLFE